MLRCEIDHLTITAPSLELGAAHVERALGVALQSGGEHPRMGTHNLLLKLGDALFLEVIAVNPAAARPPRPRWFALDGLDAAAAPRLAHWVARTGAIRSSAPDYLDLVGPIETMTRGTLQWLITIPRDGALPLGGALPALIEWQTPGHPAAQLHDKGCALRGFEIHTADPERVGTWLEALALRADVKIVALHAGESTRLVAHIETPAGLRRIGG
ncbi:MAG TPA: VOC family protein [Burkholderiaceae bacterium]|nr:VOC family protein [Burkholderiaceae bacterium]